MHQPGSRAPTPVLGPVPWVARLPLVLAALSVVLPLLALVGWTAGSHGLTSIGASASMKVNTALLLLGLAGATLAVAYRRGRAAAAALGVVSLLAAATAAEYLTVRSFGIDELLVDDPADDVFPGRPAPATLLTAGLLVLSMALVLLDRAVTAAQLAAAAGLVIALLSVAAYLYGAPQFLTGGERFSPLALPTAITCALLALAVAALRPGQGLVRAAAEASPLGRTTRLLLIASVTVPLGVGLLRLRGEEVGLYGTRAGLALFAIANVALFGVLILLGARSQSASEASRRAADAALAEVRRLHEEILDRSPTVIAAKDLDGRFILANRRLADLFGMSAQQMIGGTDLDFVDEAAAVAFQRVDEEVLRSGKPVEIEEKVPVDGEVRTFASVKFPLLDDNGRPMALGLIGVDVTERQQAEAERDRLRTRLERADRMESLGQLAGGVAHDFNNLLGVILNYVALLREDLAPTASELAAEDLGAIESAAERAAALSRQLLTFSRREGVEEATVDVNRLVQDLVTLLRRTLPENIRLESRLVAERPHVRADRSRLEQVVMNLALNARDAMPDGGLLIL